MAGPANCRDVGDKFSGQRLFSSQGSGEMLNPPTCRAAAQENRCRSSDAKRVIIAAAGDGCRLKNAVDPVGPVGHEAARVQHANAAQNGAAAR